MTGFAKTCNVCTQWQERLSSPIDSSISKLLVCQLITTTPMQKVYWSAFSEIWFWGLSDVHKCSDVYWMSLVSLHRQPPCWKLLPASFMMKDMDLSIFCDILSIMGPYSRPFHFENCWASLEPTTLWLPITPTLHPYISASGVDKNNLKWQEIKLAMNYAVGSLIAIDSQQIATM